MSEFANQMVFVGLNICDALREFLLRFELPGEGQKIERIVQKFVDKFVTENEGVVDPDSGYIFAY